MKAFGRVVSETGDVTHLFPTPEILAEADLSSVGMPRTRRETIRAIARAVCDERIRFEGIVDSESFMKRLMEIPGIGKWTAQYVEMRALGEPDAFPVGDAALLSALSLTNSAILSDALNPGGPGAPTRRCSSGQARTLAELARRIRLWLNLRK